jgi:hypothetical protein
MAATRRQKTRIEIIVFILYIIIIYCSTLIINKILSVNGDGLFIEFYYLEVSFFFINLSFFMISFFLYMRKRSIFSGIFLVYFFVASIFSGWIMLS